jgi:predicted nucleotidyltransferase
MTREEVEKATILRCLVGSQAHGLSVDDGVEDRDEMGVCIEPINRMVGFKQFEQFIYRSAAEREGTMHARSFAGDLDLTVYGLRKFCRLALQGNPTILTPLFAKPLKINSLGEQLRELAPAFASRESGKRFLGYLISQRERLVGQRGQKDVKRPELEAKYGFDTKYAYHMLRLGFQGIEFLETGRLVLPVVEPTRAYLLKVRTGVYNVEEVLSKCRELEDQLRHLLDESPLPKFPDEEKVERWMCRVYLESWKANDQWWKEYPTLLRNE